MPRRASTPRKSKYETVPPNRTTARFHAKIMTAGKQRLAERILRQALARAEASAKRPGLEVLESAPVAEHSLAGGLRAIARRRQDDAGEAGERIPRRVEPARRGREEARRHAPHGGSEQGLRALSLVSAQRLFGAPGTFHLLPIAERQVVADKE